MGQLDEAIRAHLELKRKHGASEEELKAEEQEALGPVRREQLMPEPEEPPAEEDLEEPETYDEPLVEAPSSYGEPQDDLSPEAFHEPVDPLVELGLDEPMPAAEEETETAERLAAAPPGEEGHASWESEPAAPYEGDTPARGFEAVQPVGDEEGEDVLEETPDFLQETPEHDRLWFEQKPPRDFDFDE